jgi:hypothetical protein
MALTPNYGWDIPDVDQDDDTWGDIQTTLFTAIDAQMKAVQITADAASPATTVNALLTGLVGLEGRFYRATAPDGWVAANGGTIGNAASGATTRANADTAALYAHLWVATSNTDFPIQDNTGAPSTRVGVVADYNAGKRLLLPDLRGVFGRGLDSGRGVDVGRTLGSSQLDAFQGHKMSLPNLRQVGTGASFSGSGAGDNTAGVNETGTPITDGANGAPRTASETRPRNVAALVCIKL